MQKATRLINHNIADTWWGLRRNVTPCFGARLVQEGNHLYYLADRASIAGTFNDADLRHLDQAFPVLMKRMELMLTSSELTPHIQRCLTLHAKGLICEADTLGSCGYLYIVIYPTSAITA
ncbi:type IV toxin-antitoxin system YeeU family antitoxin [Raoultella ornithinolytica]|uniref:type IV toxin-antitoxin system YeeU family antitoxin n=1 Tax=Raoultella ornithinolytica TaxID=54291 RepID=UPI00358F8060